MELTEMAKKGREVEINQSAAVKSEKKGASVEITFNSTYEANQPVLLLNNQTLINRGEIAAIVALPGSGKTQLAEAINSAFVSMKFDLDSDCLGFSFPNLSGDILHIDTERTRGDNINSYNRIGKRLNVNSNPELIEEGKIKSFKYVVITELSDINSRREHLENELATGNYSFVILDGVLDYSPSLNDEVSTKETITWLRSLASKNDVGMLLTIHPNKGTETVAGHLGAFLYRYCRSMLIIRVCQQDKSIREVTPDFPQGKLSHSDPFNFVPSCFSWSDHNGMMVSTEAPGIIPSVCEVEIINEIIQDFKNEGIKLIPAGKFKKAYMMKTGSKEETTKKHIQEAVKKGFIKKIGDTKATQYSANNYVPF